MRCLAGGYNRGECLDSVESFDIASNKWTPMAPMLNPRGRFDASHMQGKLFACGGSNGQEELRTVECYNAATQAWEPLPDMASRRSSAGASSGGARGLLYLGSARVQRGSEQIHFDNLKLKKLG